jgi:hypothetical protein
VLFAAINPAVLLGLRPVLTHSPPVFAAGKIFRAWDPARCAPRRALEIRPPSPHRLAWLVAGIIPGVERQPVKKLAPDEEGLLRLLHRWRGEAEETGRNINRISVAYEAGATASGWPAGCGRMASKRM